MNLDTSSAKYCMASPEKSRFKKTDDQSMEEYIMDFDKWYKRLKKFNLEIPESKVQMIGTDTETELFFGAVTTTSKEDEWKGDFKIANMMMNFKLDTAPEVFHRTAKQLFEGLEGMETCINDVLEAGRLQNGGCGQCCLPDCSAQIEEEKKGPLPSGATDIQRTQHLQGWLLGDKGYPLKKWFMIPMHHPQSASEERYNTALSVTRPIIEQTIGILKMHIHCMDCSGGALQYYPKRVSHIIMVCCALQNLVLQKRDHLPQGDMEEAKISSEEEDLEGQEPEDGNHGQLPREDAIAAAGQTRCSCGTLITTRLQ
ncbi:putative nuclease HARBI1 [Carcharodon carcharias]|uniref:putative nuclease HARBI1 n=1 Tax=Carcharodon carcharias TaxID=13397 RepID=UPI001B7ECB04|nr:putative nuclease HARBI1 [Carcharodon carcharias]